MKKAVIFLTLFLWGMSFLYAQVKLQSEIAKKPVDPLEDLLVISLNPNAEIRKIIESELTYWITKNGMNAQPWHKFSVTGKLPSREEIVNVISEHQFTGVLINQVKEIQEADRFEYSNRNNNYYTPGMVYTYYSYLDSYFNEYTVGYTYKEKNIIVESQVFETATSEALIHIRSSLMQRDDLDHMIEDFAKAMAKSLKKSKILAVTKN